MEIGGIRLTGDSIVRAIMNNYPNGKINLDVIRKKPLYNYLFLFGIRISTCDSGMPDDAIGGVRLVKSLMGYDFWQILFSEATTDPSPYWLVNPMSDAAQYGGTAWVKEGQWNYGLGGDYHGEPCFRPKEPITVYRWTPSKAEIADSKKNKIALSSRFDLAKESGNIKTSQTDTVLIHRSWNPNKLWKDSAGCQVFAQNGQLETLYSWAKLHNSIYKTPYNNTFTYTLLNREQFVRANMLTNQSNIISPVGQDYNLGLQIFQ